MAIRARKKQKVAGNDDDDNCSETYGNIFCHEMIACEILCRLRVKSLMRFKCVCKHWKFLIEQDKHFIDLHLTHSKKRPCLLIQIPHYIDRNYFLAADLLFQGRKVSAAVHTVVADGNKFVHWIPISGIVNGLSCLLESNTCRSEGSICIWNVSTQEMTPRIESTLHARLHEEVSRSSVFGSICRLVNYAMGFSPATKEHKVIFIWKREVGFFRVYYIYEVLTVGDNKWRRIHHDKPQHKIQHNGASVYSNGVIYFETVMLNDKTHKGDKFIVAFDVDTEKFTSIKIPHFIFNQRTKDCFIQLLEMDCCLALITRISTYEVKLWVKYQENYWEEVPIELSAYWGRAQHQKFHSVGADQIISHYIPGSYRGKVRKGSLSFYNWRNRDDVKITKIGVRGIPERVAAFSSATGVTTYVESLLRVN